MVEDSIPDSSIYIGEQYTVWSSEDGQYITVTAREVRGCIVECDDEQGNEYNLSYLALNPIKKG